MRELQRKIKRLQAEMNKNHRKMRIQSRIIKKFTHSAPFVITGAVGGFVGGYLIGKKRSVPELIKIGRSASKLARTAKRVIRLLGLLG